MIELAGEEEREQRDISFIVVLFGMPWKWKN